MNLALIGLAITLFLGLFLGKNFDFKSLLDTFNKDKNKELENVKNITKIENLSEEEIKLQNEITKPKEMTSDEMLKYFNKK